MSRLILVSPDEIGTVMRQIRKSKGMKSKDVCSKAHMTTSTLNHFESGTRLNYETFKSISGALDLEYFFGLTFSRDDFNRYVDYDNYLKEKGK